jgi:putative transposase
MGLDPQGGSAGGGPGAGRGVKDTVSRLCRGLDEQVQAFRERPLEGAYPYLWLDAKVEKVRAGGRVEHHALVVAYGVDATGQREVIGLDVGAAETEAFWREFLPSLVRRGLAGVQLVISDAHQGLEAAIAQVLGAPWQRCTVHFLRDALGHCPKDLQQLVGAAIRPIFRAATLEEARRLLEETVAHLEGGCPRSPGCCWRPSPTCWPSTPFPLPTAPSCAPPIRWSGSTARSAGAPTWSGCSPTMRRAGSLLIEQNDEWLVSRRYLSETSMAELSQTSTTDPTTGKELQVAQSTPTALVVTPTCATRPSSNSVSAVQSRS